jgi:predicted ArsR family transcriptional regulator
MVTPILQVLSMGGRYEHDWCAMGWLEAVADPVRLGIVRHLAQHGPATLNELADAVGAVPETVRRHIMYLVQGGVVEGLGRHPDGETRGRPAVRYRLTEETLASLRGSAQLRRAPG